jgi:translocation and assembly module TamA
MNRILILVLLAAVVPVAAPQGAAAQGAEGGRFLISGNGAVSDEGILRALDGAGCAGADSACLKSMCDSVAQVYWSLGYMDVNVTCTGGEGGETARVDIAEGPVSPVATVEIRGASPEGRMLIEPIFQPAVGKPFSPAGFETQIGRALQAYDRAGYPVASITPAVTAGSGQGLGLVLNVDEGPRATIGAVEFEGVTETRHSVLERETGLKPGELYDGSRVAEARQNLLGLGVFEEVSEPRLSINPADSSIVVTFEAVEARTSLIEGALAYGPGAGGNEWYGQVEVDLRNIAGTLRRAGVYWMQRGSGRSAWSLRYREPRLFSLPVGLEGGIDSDLDETSYERKRISLRLVQQDGRRMEISGGWFLASVREGPLVDTDETHERNSYTENGVDLGLAYDGTDRVVNPTRGPRLDLGLEASSLKCKDCDAPDRSIWSGLFGGSYIFGIAGNTVGFLGARMRVVSADPGPVPSSHLIRVGGVNNLRGYPEEWFLTDRVLVLTAEIRYIVGPLSRLYVFLDAGTLDDMVHDFGDTGSLLAGYGFGLTTGSRVGVFQVEVATARGEPVSEAKLHLKLSQRF